MWVKGRTDPRNWSSTCSMADRVATDTVLSALELVVLPGFGSLERWLLGTYLEGRRKILLVNPNSHHMRSRARTKNPVPSEAPIFQLRIFQPILT